MIQVDIDQDVYLPCYQHLLDDNDIDIELIWGGRDSGKSKFVAMLSLENSMALSYFRCLLIKQTAESIKDSQWQMIKDTADDWGVDPLFKFQIAPLGIRSNVNNNSFSARGMDDPAKIKSFANPSHAWIEEGNDISEDAFITMLSGMRNDYGRVKIYITFNPEVDVPDYIDFWIYRWFFAKHEGELNFTDKIIIPVRKDGKDYEVVFKYRSTHTTYHNNEYVSLQRIAFHEMLSGNPYYYRVYTLGLWGNRKNDDPFCYTFDRARHVRKTQLNRIYEVKLSFDFNVNPITCGVYQDYNNWIYGIESIKLENSDIYKLCQYVVDNYKGCLFLVTGDATGKNRTAMVEDGINYYTIIKAKLNLSAGQLRVPSVNPRVAENRVLVNAVMHKINEDTVNVALDPVGCKALIFDLENVSVNDVGDIDKGNRSNPKKRADHIDNWRYYLNVFHKATLKQ